MLLVWSVIVLPVLLVRAAPVIRQRLTRYHLEVETAPSYRLRVKTARKRSSITKLALSHLKNSAPDELTRYALGYDVGVVLSLMSVPTAFPRAEGCSLSKLG